MNYLVEKSINNNLIFYQFKIEKNWYNFPIFGRKKQRIFEKSILQRWNLPHGEILQKAKDKYFFVVDSLKM